MYLFYRKMVAATNYKYANSSSNYYVTMVVTKFEKISNLFRISEAPSAELKHTTAKRLLFARARREAT